MDTASSIGSAQREVKPKAGKAPTRLQKHAPASLQLDKIPATSPFSGASGETPKAIPLLSPLVLSPEPLPETVEKRLSESENGHEKRSLCSPAGGWKHPAVATFTEPPNLLALLQSQCVLVDNVQ
ncbi:uncharacterized protein LOC132164647 [Corylus avellana]|uniref:uncharacterized protein LOC132164647 n=1 Tax=Corylus avellana TaxID=13451 RepID=UPI00286B2304|nr:uncharacterized protein LOC132164647 [Corylus avellana]